MKPPIDTTRRMLLGSATAGLLRRLSWLNAMLLGEAKAMQPGAPKMQPRGMRVAFLHDPAGLLWHIAEQPQQP